MCEVSDHSVLSGRSDQLLSTKMLWGVARAVEVCLSQCGLAKRSLLSTKLLTLTQMFYSRGHQFLLSLSHQRPRNHRINNPSFNSLKASILFLTLSYSRQPVSLIAVLEQEAFSGLDLSTST